jgi:hypothetical protein
VLVADQSIHRPAAASRADVGAIAFVLMVLSLVLLARPWRAGIGVRLPARRREQRRDDDRSRATPDSSTRNFDAARRLAAAARRAAIAPVMRASIPR